MKHGQPRQLHKSGEMIYRYEVSFRIMESNGGDIRKVNEEEFSRCAIGSGDSISRDAEVDIDALINLDQDKGASIERKSLLQNNCLCRVQLRTYM